MHQVTILLLLAIQENYFFEIEIIMFNCFLQQGSLVIVMKDNFLKLGILGGRDVPFDTILFS
jgi:hypothetical protein